MGKLIDADAVLEIVDRARLFGNGNYLKVRKLIEDLPEAVVRCKDCIFYASAKGYSFGVCKYFNRDEDDTDYCNSGERRTDEKPM